MEVKFLGGGAVAVRNSKDPSGPSVTFTADEWDAFLGGAKSDEFAIPEHAR